MNLSWSAATGGNGQYSYVVSRGSLALAPVTTTSMIDSGLTPQTTYNYTVSAIDTASHQSPPSAPPVSGTTYANPVVSFTASAVSSTSVRLTWSVNLTNVPGGSLTYSVMRGSTPVAGCTVSPCTDSGLTPGGNYTYTLTATDSAGYGVTSTAQGTPYALPQITSFTATAASSSAINLAWVASDTGGSGGLTYSVVNTTLNRAVPNCTGITASSCSDSGLSGGANYNYQLTATDSANDFATRTAGTSTLPGSPGTPTFSSITLTSATVSWTAAAGAVTSYSYSMNGGSSWTSVGTALTVSLTGLTPGTTYTVLVRAESAGGSGTSSFASFTTVSGVTVPQNVSGWQPLVGGTWQVSWSASVGPVSYYTLSISPATKVGSTFTITAPATTSAWFAALLADTTFSFKVQACTAAGSCSPWSSTATLLVYGTSSQ
jgi:hypothetical protein